MLYEFENFKDNIPTLRNNFENNITLRKHGQNEEDNGSTPKIPKNKLRRNATHRIAFEKKENIKKNTMNNQVNAIKQKPQKEYNFQIIDINNKDNLDNEVEESDESIDSEEGFYDVNENHKYDIPKLIFYEEHVKDKDKRKISKIAHVEIKADANFLKDKTRIKELNDEGFKNIITIINCDPKVLPSHELNLNPSEISEYIKGKEKNLERDNISFLKDNIVKKVGEKDEDENEIKNISFFSRINSKSGSFFHDEDNSKNKIINFDNDDDESQNI